MSPAGHAPQAGAFQGARTGSLLVSCANSILVSVCVCVREKERQKERKTGDQLNLSCRRDGDPKDVSIPGGSLSPYNATTGRGPCF